jgi:hypothetical protein
LLAIEKLQQQLRAQDGLSWQDPGATTLVNVGVVSESLSVMDQ